MMLCLQKLLERGIKRLSELRIGIGISLNSNAHIAALEALKQARQAVSKATIALVFGSIHLNQEQVYAGLIEGGLDPSIVFGGSSYAEISPAGVTYKSLAIMLIELPEATLKTISVPLQEDPKTMGRVIYEALGDWQTDDNKLNIGLIFSALSSGRDNEMLASLRQRISQLAMFGGMACGDYDLGMDHPEFWTTYQYCEGALQQQVRLAALQLPRSQYKVAFGCGHGWEPLGPSHVVTRSEGSTVYEVDGMPILEFYRQFLGRDADDQFFELLIQRFGIALQMEKAAGPRTTVKVPVKIDRKAGCMTFYPVDDLHGRQINLIQANRKSLIAGARRAAEQCLAGLEGQKPSLVLVVSCSVRGAILHSRSNAEIEAVCDVMGRNIPIIGWYSGGEIMPLLNRFDDVINEQESLGGAGFHGTTIGLLALSSKERPTQIVIPDKIERRASGVDLEQLLKQSEETLDSTEAFLANLSRQVYHNGERLRAQSEVLHRYTPHEVWDQAGASAERGDYEIADSEFNGAFLFMDVKGFTSYSEEHSPQEVVQALNALFEPATDIIYDCGGDVDKYMGDCIFAAFHQKTRAVEAGQRILIMFRKLRAQGTPFNVRLGINSGRAIRANVGGVDRREYTFIGDAVNLAQRLESNCTPGKMLISEELYELVGTSLNSFERRVITAKGKREPIVVYECEP